jgi:hypothetical protein
MYFVPVYEIRTIRGTCHSPVAPTCVDTPNIFLPYDLAVTDTGNIIMKISAHHTGAVRGYQDLLDGWTDLVCPQDVT